jgi:hypothetical protein
MNVTAKAQMQVRRGPESWNYIYIFLGFVLAIEGDVIQLLELEWPQGLIVYVVLAALTIYLFLENAWFQN